MKSNRIRNVAGQAKLKGKREKVLSCGCCVVFDLRFRELCKQAEEEIDKFDVECYSDDVTEES